MPKHVLLTVFPETSGLSQLHARQVVFQMAEVAIPRELFRAILQAIGRLRLPAEASG